MFAFFFKAACSVDNPKLKLYRVICSYILKDVWFNLGLPKIRHDAAVSLEGKSLYHRKVCAFMK